MLFAFIKLFHPFYGALSWCSTDLILLRHYESIIWEILAGTGILYILWLNFLIMWENLCARRLFGINASRIKFASILGNNFKGFPQEFEFEPPFPDICLTHTSFKMRAQTTKELNFRQCFTFKLQVSKNQRWNDSQIFPSNNLIHQSNIFCCFNFFYFYSYDQ